MMTLQEISQSQSLASKWLDIALRGAVTLMLAAATLVAQTGGGATLVGTVRDSTGSAVAGAKVTVVNTATAFLAETTTSTDGAYYVPY